MRRSRWVAFALAGGALFSFGTPRAAESQLRPGTRAPEIDLKTRAGQRIRLSSLRGRPVIVTIWATWCPSCRDEFPELTALYNRLQHQGLRVLAVNERDQENDDAAVDRFVAEFAPSFPVLIDPRGASRRAYHVIGLPTTIFIDTSGVIQRFHSGPLRAEELRAGAALILPPK